MPWFHHKSDEERRQEEETRQEQAQAAQLQQTSLEALQRGGIPLQAQRRLDELRSRESPFFTSDLSVNEFLLARQAGYQPLTQVMGSSIYHVGWQRTPGYWGSSHELDVVSGAMNHCRELALSRLQEESSRVGADAVIGVRISRGTYDWADDLVEFNALGTAVRVTGMSKGSGPVLTNLSGQDFWKLHQAGFMCSGIAASSTVYYVVAGWRTQQANSRWGGGWVNQELVDFTQGVYMARHYAMSRIYQQAAASNGSGIVGMDIDQEFHEHEVNLGNDQERTDLIATFHVIGTVIRDSGAEEQIPAITTVVNLKK